MSNRSYQQYCAIAAALDRIGDRWTLLILRELWVGDSRFTDLRRTLPGIAPNLLAERLRQLEHDGLVEQRELPAPAARTVYALTDDGLRVAPVLRAVGRFGLPFLGDPVEGRVQPRMAVHAVLGALFDPLAAAGRDLLVRFDLDGEELWLKVRAGELVPAESGHADLTFVGSAAVLVDVARGGLELAAAAPRLRVQGGSRAKRAFAEMFPFGATNCI
ncbi:MULTISPECIES: winged helix-turn-helix transcriptional regulator [Nocardioides]|uniref:Winged helix-turn-helix transcriptional regulator n=1 Tax=Nocardioides vastitatis TaxID=2568655 RepID=A0ABW0ZPC5_9ACTN|nr:helix-turn-helix domain-containing protein [Nocardioides sp.]THJ16034.1 helix-turn-helix transcriptional regulator [Nocardioides sp.]